MKLKDLLLESEVEASIEDALNQVKTDLKKADIDNDTTDEAIGVLTLAGVALSAGEIAKVIGKFINLVSKIPGLKRLSGDKLIKKGEKFHSAIVATIQNILILAGVKDKEKANKFANGIHMLLVAALLSAGLGPMAAKFDAGKYAGAGLKAALNAVKTKELVPYMIKLAARV